MSPFGQKATSVRPCGMCVPLLGTDMRVTGRFAPKAALGEFEIQLPLYSQKQTQLGSRGTSEKCQTLTSA
jgi:hypothetical protein